MKRKKEKLNSRRLVNRIKNDLKRKKIWRAGQLEYAKVTNKSELESLRQKIEYSLIAARDYQDPVYVFPRNPVTRFIKKTILRAMRVFTRYQIVYNRNVTYLLEDIYRYLEIVEKKFNEKNSRN